MRKNRLDLNRPKRERVERDLHRVKQEVQAHSSELKDLRPTLERVRAERNTLKKANEELRREYDALESSAVVLMQRAETYRDEREAARDFREQAQRERDAALERLRVVEAAGRDLLEFLPTGATGRARYSKHAKAAVAFREALETTPGEK